MADLARRLGVTPATIRRDLDALQDAGHVERTHGGAVLSKAGHIEFRLRHRSEAMADAKRAIARAAARHVRPGMTLSLDTGTTTLEVARALTAAGPIQVLTSSLAIAAVLHPHERIRLILLGGQARQNDPDLFGDLTEENLARFHVDLAIVGADGVTADGLWAEDPQIVGVSRAMIRGAERCLLVADSTKFGRKAFCRVAGWDRVSDAITDSRLPARERAWARKAGRLTLAAPEEKHT